MSKSKTISDSKSAIFGFVMILLLLLSGCVSISPSLWRSEDHSNNVVWFYWGRRFYPLSENKPLPPYITEFDLYDAEHLIAVLKDKDYNYQMRLAACQTLREVGCQKAASTLKDVLLDDKDDFFVKKCAQATLSEIDPVMFNAIPFPAGGKEPPASQK